MSRVDDETRRQVLTRIAVSRVRAVDAAEVVQKGAQGCVRAFPISATSFKMAAVALGGLALSGVVSVKLFGKKKKPKAEPELKGSVVALQAISALAIPLLHRWLVSGGTESRTAESRTAESPAPAPSGSNPHSSGVSSVFFRWLGLTK